MNLPLGVAIVWCNYLRLLLWAHIPLRTIRASLGRDEVRGSTKLEA